MPADWDCVEDGHLMEFGRETCVVCDPIMQLDARLARIERPAVQTHPGWWNPAAVVDEILNAGSPAAPVQRRPKLYRLRKAIYGPDRWLRYLSRLADSATRR